MKSTIFWDVRPSSLDLLYQLLGGTYCFHLQGRRVSQVSKKQETCLLGSCFDPEDRGGTFLRNVDKFLLPNYTAPHPRMTRIYLQFVACNMKYGEYCNLVMVVGNAGVNITIQSSVINNTGCRGQATSKRRAQSSTTKRSVLNL
jgi:hypothetical protein